MKPFAFALALLSIFAAPAFAQNSAPRLEVFGGVEWLRADISPFLAPVGLAHVNGYGWNASATENLNRWFGGTLDFSGAYARPSILVPANSLGAGIPPTDTTLTNEINASAYTFMYGPSFAYRRSDRFVPFARVLLGDANGRVSTTSKGAATLAAFGISPPPHFSQNHFAFAVGGGLDVALSPRIALRGTADWIRSMFPDLGDDRQNNLRIAAGLVFRFGSAQ